MAKTRYAGSQVIGKFTRQSDPIPAATDFYTIMKMVLGKRDANLTIEQGRGSCEKEPHPDGTNYHPYQSLIHTQFLLPTVSQTLSCENTYSPASAYLTYAEQRRHETAGWNFFPRPTAFLAHDTSCPKKILPAVLHFVTALQVHAAAARHGRSRVSKAIGAFATNKWRQ